MGRHKLTSVVSDMAKRVGLDGKVTNHSLCATAASRLYHSNVDEQLVIECTGHHSTSVCEYKSTSDFQLESVSSVLYGNNDGKDDAASALKVKCI